MADTNSHYNIPTGAERLENTERSGRLSIRGGVTMAVYYKGVIFAAYPRSVTVCQTCAIEVNAIWKICNFLSAHDAGTRTREIRDCAPPFSSRPGPKSSASSAVYTTCARQTGRPDGQTKWSFRKKKKPTIFQFRPT